MTGLRAVLLPLAAVLVAAAAAFDVQAQLRGPPQVVPAPSGSRGENFSAGRPPAQLFTSDCTGSGCHRGPHGLSKGRSSGALASFLREHYTNSRESAAALAAYLVAVPREAPRPPEPPAAAAPQRGRQAAAPEPSPEPPPPPKVFDIFD